MVRTILTTDSLVSEEREQGVIERLLFLNFGCQRCEIRVLVAGWRELSCQDLWTGEVLYILKERSLSSRRSP